MTPEDHELWKRVTQSVAPLVVGSSAATIRSYASVWRPGLRTTLDLHGFTLNQAHETSRAFVQEARNKRYKYVTIITGKSGFIRKEFLVWASLMTGVRRVEPLNGGGAFKLYLVKATPN